MTSKNKSLNQSTKLYKKIDLEQFRFLVARRRYFKAFDIRLIISFMLQKSNFNKTIKLNQIYYKDFY